MRDFRPRARAAGGTIAQPTHAQINRVGGLSSWDLLKNDAADALPQLRVGSDISSRRRQCMSIVTPPTATRNPPLDSRHLLCARQYGLSFRHLSATPSCRTTRRRGRNMLTQEQGEIERLRRELDAAEARTKAAEQRAGFLAEQDDFSRTPHSLSQLPIGQPPSTD